MKKVIGFFVLAVSAIGLQSYRLADKAANDVFQVLGIPKEMAYEAMRDNLLYASLNVPFSGENLKNTPSAKRVAIVNEVGMKMKEYFSSEEMAEAYKAYRESIMPGRQDGVDINEKIAEIKQNIQQTEKDKSVAPADMKKVYDDAILQMKNELKILQNPSHPDYKVYAGIIELSPGQQEELNRQIQEFSKEYPEEVKQYLELKLVEFLELTSDIDFNAKLFLHKEKWKFENPVYEAMDYNWKKCFRAGKETIEAARAFAGQWLKELK